MKEAWPAMKAERKDKAAFDDLQTVIDVITAIRKLRADQNVEHSKEVSVTLVTKEWSKLLESQQAHIKRLAKVESLTIAPTPLPPPPSSGEGENGHFVSAFLPGIEVHLSLAGLVDLEKERENLLKEKEQLQKYVAGIEAKLQNKNFVARAAANVVEMERGKLKEAQEKLKKIEERLQAF